MQAGREFMLFASVAIALFGMVASRDVRIYASAKPPKEVLNRITETRRPLGCKAHVLPTTVFRKATYLTITVNLRGLPSHLNDTFLLDELYIDIQNGGSLNTAAQKTNELWVEEQETKTLLARVPLNFSRNGYRAIKMRSVFASWSANNKQTAVLKVKLALTPKKLAKHLLKSQSFFVIYAYSITAPASPKCESYNVTIKPPQILLNAVEFQTKICSPPDDVTFPFNGSSYFDMGTALRKSLKDNPIPRNEAVLTNPKCCQATKAISKRFARIDPKKTAVHVFELANVKITECGCVVH